MVIRSCSSNIIVNHCPSLQMFHPTPRTTTVEGEHLLCSMIPNALPYRRGCLLVVMRGLVSSVRSFTPQGLSVRSFTPPGLLLGERKEPKRVESWNSRGRRSFSVIVIDLLCKISSSYVQAGAHEPPKAAKECVTPVPCKYKLFRKLT